VRRLLALTLALVACAPAAPDGADAGPCRLGFLATALGGCRIDPLHPPCECVRSMTEVGCCSGDVCCNGENCFGQAACVDGLLTCGPNSQFISFSSLCEGDDGH
jgi:hypothetical protein